MFPWLLHDLLEEATVQNFEHIVSWNPSGLSFKVHDREAFMNEVLPRYVSQTRYKSFVRQLNMWGYICMHGGRTAPERGSYRHPCFVRGNPSLCANMVRCKIKSKNQKINSGSNGRNKTQRQSVSATANQHDHGHSQPPIALVRRSDTIGNEGSSPAAVVAASRTSSTTLLPDTVTSSGLQSGTAATVPKRNDKSSSSPPPSSFLDFSWESKLASIAASNPPSPTISTPLDDMIAASIRDGFGYEKTDVASPVSPQSSIMAMQEPCRPHQVLRDDQNDLSDTMALPLPSRVTPNTDNSSRTSRLGDVDQETACLLDGFDIMGNVPAVAPSAVDSLLQGRTGAMLNADAAELTQSNCDRVSSDDHGAPMIAQAGQDARDDCNRNESIAAVASTVSSSNPTECGPPAREGNGECFPSESNHLCASNHDHQNGGEGGLSPWAPPPLSTFPSRYFLNDKSAGILTGNECLQSSNSSAPVLPYHEYHAAAEGTSSIAKRTFSISDTLDELLRDGPNAPRKN